MAKNWVGVSCGFYADRLLHEPWEDGKLFVVVGGLESGSWRNDVDYIGSLFSRFRRWKGIQKCICIRSVEPVLRVRGSGWQM